MFAATSLLLNPMMFKHNASFVGVTGDPGGRPPGRDPFITTAVLIVIAMAFPIGVCIVTDLARLVL
jgi:hypothetical protein